MSQEEIQAHVHDMLTYDHHPHHQQPQLYVPQAVLHSPGASPGAPGVVNGPRAGTSGALSSVSSPGPPVMSHLGSPSPMTPTSGTPDGAARATLTGLGTPAYDDAAIPGSGLPSPGLAEASGGTANARSSISYPQNMIPSTSTAVLSSPAATAVPSVVCAVPPAGSLKTLFYGGDAPGLSASGASRAPVNTLIGILHPPELALPTSTPHKNSPVASAVPSAGLCTPAPVPVTAEFRDASKHWSAEDWDSYRRLMLKGKQPEVGHGISQHHHQLPPDVEARVQQTRTSAQVTTSHRQRFSWRPSSTARQTVLPDHASRRDPLEQDLLRHRTGSSEVARCAHVTRVGTGVLQDQGEVQRPAHR